MNAIAIQNQSMSMQALVPRNVPEAVQLSETLAQSALIPKHLQGKPGDCLLIVMQAQRWGMDVLSVAQCTSVVHGKLCYEGKLVAAVLYSMGAVDGRLSYSFNGTGTGRSVTVTGTPRGMDEQQSVTGTVADWATTNEQWKKAPDDMLVYRGTRQWARRYAPEALLGVYTPDELEDEPREPRTVTVTQSSAHGGKKELPPYPDADFETNLPKWRALILDGKKSADQIIVTIESKATLTEAQREQIRTGRPPDAPLEGELVDREDAA